MIWIGVDAHKQVHQAVAISEQGIIGARTIPNIPAAWAALLEWARQWPERIWCGFRSNPITHFGPIRSPVSDESDQQFRSFRNALTEALTTTA